MAIVEVYSHAEFRRYKAPLCSKAVIFQILATVCLIVPPLFVAYRSRSFWIKTYTYREQMIANFLNEMIVLADVNNNGDYVAWSTYQNFNLLQQEHLRPCIVKARDVDDTGDGGYERFEMSLELPLKDNEEVYGIKMLLFFQVDLMRYVYFYSKGMAYIHYEAPRPGAKLQYVADFTLNQKEPVTHKGWDYRNNLPVFNSSSYYAEDLDFFTLIREYQSRNVTVKTVNEYPMWVAGRGAGQPFVVNVTINYPYVTVEYYTGMWQMLKWAWVQYIATVFVFWFILEKLKRFFFENQLIPTIVERPWKSHTS